MFLVILFAIKLYARTGIKKKKKTCSPDDSLNIMHFN